MARSSASAFCIKGWNDDAALIVLWCLDATFICASVGAATSLPLRDVPAVGVAWNDVELGGINFQGRGEGEAKSGYNGEH